LPPPVTSMTPSVAYRSDTIISAMAKDFDLCPAPSYGLKVSLSWIEINNNPGLFVVLYIWFITSMAPWLPVGNLLMVAHGLDHWARLPCFVEFLFVLEIFVYRIKYPSTSQNAFTDFTYFKKFFPSINDFEFRWYLVIFFMFGGCTCASILEMQKIQDCDGDKFFGKGTAPFFWPVLQCIVKCKIAYWFYKAAWKDKIVNFATNSRTWIPFWSSVVTFVVAVLLIRLEWSGIATNRASQICPFGHVDPSLRVAALATAFNNARTLVSGVSGSKDAVVQSTCKVSGHAPMADLLLLRQGVLLQQNMFEYLKKHDDIFRIYVRMVQNAQYWRPLFEADVLLPSLCYNFVLRCLGLGI
jgi:hypothetical protein